MLWLSNLFQMTLCKLFQSLPHTLLSEIDEDAILVVAQPWMWADSNLQPKSTNEHLRLHASSTNIAWARREQERERRNKKKEKSVNIHVFMLTGFPAVLPWKKICQPPFKWKKATLTHTKKPLYMLHCQSAPASQMTHSCACLASAPHVHIGFWSFHKTHPWAWVRAAEFGKCSTNSRDKIT